jgi:fibronectin type 3 domain-containing protein
MLRLESLESRQLLAAGDAFLGPLPAATTEFAATDEIAEGENPNADVRFRYEFTNLSGQPITEVQVGEQVDLNVFVQDVRTNGTGVFAPYLDVAYSPGFLTNDGQIVLGGTYTNFPSGTLVDGFIDEAGAFDGLAPLGSSEFLVFQVRFTPENPGNVTFSGEPADEAPDHDLLVYGSVVPLTADRVDYGMATLTVNPSSGMFDFGTASSPLQPGYARITPFTNYNAATGYGWQSGSVDARDRGAGSALDRDLNFTPNGTFVSDLPNGHYKVTVRLGDTGYVHEQMGIFLENEAVRTVSLNREAKSEVYSNVEVADGQLTLRLDDLGGSDPNVVIVGLEYEAVGSPAPTLALSVAPSSFAEDSGQGAAVGTITRTGPATSALTVNLTSSDSCEATVPSTVTIAANQTSATFRIDAVDDTETDGAASVVIGASATGFAAQQATVSVTDNDVPPFVGQFDFGTNSSPLQSGYVRVSPSTTYNASCGYGWQNGGIDARDRGTGSALDRDMNFTALGTFAVDVLSGTYDVIVKLGDMSAYPHDQMGVFVESEAVRSVSLQGETKTETYDSLEITDGQLTLRLDDLGGSDPNVVIVGLEVTAVGPTLPSISIDDFSGLEGNSGTTDFDFTIRLSEAAADDVTVQFATGSGSASAPTDFSATSGTLTIAAGQTTGTVSVEVNGDTTVEPNESFVVNLSNPTNAVLADNQGQATILTDDVPPGLTLSIAPAVFSEGAGGAAATGTLLRTGPTSTSVTINLSSSDTSEATVPTSVTMAANQNSITFPIAAVDDSDVDGAQSVVITASATGFSTQQAGLSVTDNDVPPIAPFASQYDFGTASSPIQTGYTRVTHTTTYNASRGYGWQSGSIDSRDRGNGSALDRDLNFTRNGTFVVDVPDGTYNVTVRLGDTSPYVHDQMGVILEGEPTRTVTLEGQVKSEVYNDVQVSDGQLTLKLTDLGGRDPNVVIVGLMVEASGPAPPTLSINVSPTSFSEDGGDNVATGSITRTGSLEAPLTVNLSSSDVSEATVATSVTIGTNQSSASFAVDAVDDDQNDGSQSVVISAAATGFATQQTSVTVTDDEQPPFDGQYDFGTFSSPVQAGYVRIAHATSYNATTGFGWRSGGIDSRDRGNGDARDRDLNFTRNGTFVVDVPNGSYDVTVRMGDRGPYQHDQMGVFLEGTQVDSISTSAGQVVSRTFRVDVLDSQLSLALRDLGGSDPNVTIESVDIVIASLFGG